MGELRVEFEDGKTVYRPGESIRGTVRWRLDEASVSLPESVPESMEVRLFWYTMGKGDTDVGIADSTTIDAPGSEGSRSFDFTAPQAPLSFSGHLISLVWAVELVALPHRAAFSGTGPPDVDGDPIAAEGVIHRRGGVGSFQAPLAARAMGRAHDRGVIRKLSHPLRSLSRPRPARRPSPAPFAGPVRRSNAPGESMSSSTPSSGISTSRTRSACAPMRCRAPTSPFDVAHLGEEAGPRTGPDCPASRGGWRRRSRPPPRGRMHPGAFRGARCALPACRQGTRSRPPRLPREGGDAAGERRAETRA